MDEPPFALSMRLALPASIIAKGGSFSTVSTLRLYSSTSLACGFSYEKKTVPPPGGTVLDIFLVQLYKKVCQSQSPTDFLFAPEIIFGTFSKPARHSAE